MNVVQALLPILGFLTGLWAATFLQDRDTRRRHLGIVRALLAEVRRVRQEAGAGAVTPIPIKLFGMSPSVPELHPWVHNIVTDVASSAPDLLPLILDLERYLTNLRTMGLAAEGTSASVEAATERRRGAEADYDAMVDLAAIPDGLAAVMNAERVESQAENAASLAASTHQSAFRRVRETLDALERCLVKHERQLSAGFWTHLRWR